jgi:acetyl-CoA carboxylase biotin carboxyl carrier protein
VTSLTQDDLIEIMELLESSTFEELMLETGDLKLVLSKTPGGRVETSVAADPPAAEAPVVEAPAISPAPSAPADYSPAASAEGKLTPIKAPILGVFYAAPKPGAPPFVQAGDRVGPDDPVCIIEVMKLFNTITAGVSGRVVEVAAQNGDMVEYGQPLFWVDQGAPAAV